MTDNNDLPNDNGKEVSSKPAIDSTYEPRRSNRVAADATAADGDTWKERLAVCEAATPDGKPQLMIRSYFLNSRTAERVWDEPPSGASTIKHATAEMRKEADVQLQELQLTLDMIPADEEHQQLQQAKDASTGSGSANLASKKKVGFFGRLRGKKPEKKTVEDSKDLNLQRAIARSLNQQYGSAEDVVIYYDSGAKRPGATNDDDDVALAKAISMSETLNQMSEEEMIQMALEQSRIDVVENAGKVPSELPPSSSLPVPQEPSWPGTAAAGLEDLDQKMPAVITTSSKRPTDQFDPLA